MANSTAWVTTEGDKKKSVTIHVGDTIRVHYKLIEHEKVAGKTKREVKEETRERIQVFEGILLAIKGSGNNEMITVRHMGVGAIGVERILPLVSPWIKKIEVKKRGDVRRAKLYYLRARQGKAATRITESAPQPATSA
ncbi:MAG: 50S ribosomal protein L19 [Patescibacteria group bacterium]